MTGVGGGNIRNHVQFNLYTNKQVGEGDVRGETAGGISDTSVPEGSDFFFFFSVKGIAVAFFHSNR